MTDERGEIPIRHGLSKLKFGAAHLRNAKSGIPSGRTPGRTRAQRGERSNQSEDFAKAPLVAHFRPWPRLQTNRSDLFHSFPSILFFCDPLRRDAAAGFEQAHRPQMPPMVPKRGTPAFASASRITDA